MIADTYSGQKWILESLDLELQRFVSFPTEVLGTEIGSSARVLLIAEPSLLILNFTS